MNNLVEIIKKRRSIRTFTAEPVPDEHLDLMLDAARNAPSAGNGQPWRFLVVRERDNLARLLALLEPWLRARIEAAGDPETQAERFESALDHLREILTAPLFVFVWVDASLYPALVVYDGALAAQNLMLAARAIGYGTCFMTTFFPEDIMHIT